MKYSLLLSVILITIFVSIKSFNCTNQCPEGWELYNHEKCLTILRNATNSFDVDDACGKVGGEPWMYQTSIEDEFLWDYWKMNFPEQNYTFLWIGLTLEDGNYKWRDGTPANDVGVNAACVKGAAMICPQKVLRRDMKDSLICPFECSRANVYPVCEKWLVARQPTIPSLIEDTTIVETTTTTEHPRVKLPESPLCEPGWDLFQGRCYHLTPNKYNGGSGARVACSMVGAQVVSVESLEQQNFFETVIFYKDHGLAGDHYEGPAFLGARRNGNNSFVWETEKPLEFTHWAPGEPSSGNCIIISRSNGSKGKWKTISCNISQRVLCGKPTIIGATTEIPSPETDREQFSDVIPVGIGEREEVSEEISKMENSESNSEQDTKNPINNASLVISIVVIILVAILFLICFVLRVRRKAQQKKGQEKLEPTEKNGHSTTYEPTNQSKA